MKEQGKAEENSFSIATALVLLFPLCLLFYGSTTGFTSDWYNSIWMMGYQKYSYLYHGIFSDVYNTCDLVGNPQAVFYGHLFYPLMGLLSIPVGPHIALRWAVIAVCLLEFLIVYRTVKRFSENGFVAFVVAVLFSWSVYPLTNLYTRSALPEFFAGKFLVILLCSLLNLIKSTDRFEKNAWTWMYAVFLSLCLGTHPITAFYGSLMVVLCFVSLFRKREDVILFLVGSVGAGLVILPWVLALLLFSKELSIAKALAEFNPMFHAGIDTWWVRLFPLPLDLRALHGGYAVPTPNLDAQINFPLLVFAVFLGVRTKAYTSKAFWGFVSLLIFCWAVSVGWIPTNFANSILKKIQILYRWAALINIILLFWVLFLCRRSVVLFRNEMAKTREVLMLTLGMAFCAVALKLVHAYPITHEATQFGYSALVTEKEFSSVPRSFYSSGDYVVRNDYRLFDPKTESLQGEAVFEVGEGKDFGSVKPYSLAGRSPGWYATRVLVFPWNELRINGNLIEKDRLLRASDKFIFRYDGEAHPVLTYEFKPPMYWKISRVVGALLFGLLLLFPFVFYRKLKKSFLC